ncbi:translation initiation factor IF-2-like [Cervus canadensis]|uniref:translation initiation factor IF-2-like n=1 Tax=Cervus canadensis TaxID=1574408 RepID=UPI001C9E8C0B|nr:translation initiation factor IF-2-like [Cervus canadensis]
MGTGCPKKTNRMIRGLRLCATRYQSDLHKATPRATLGTNLPHALHTGGTPLPISLPPRSPPPLSLEPGRRRRTPLSLKRPSFPGLPRSLTCRSEGGSRCTPRGKPQSPGSPVRTAPPAGAARDPRAPRCAPTAAVGLRPGKARRGLPAASAARGGPPVSGGAGAGSRPSAPRRRRRRRATCSASRAAQPGGEREGDGNGGGAAQRRHRGRRREGSAGGPGSDARSARSLPRRAGGSHEAAVPSGPRRSSAPCNPRPAGRSLTPPPRRGRRTLRGRPQPRPLRAGVGRSASAEGERVRGGACVVERARPRPLHRLGVGSGEEREPRPNPSLRREVGPRFCRSVRLYKIVRLWMMVLFSKEDFTFWQ